MKKEGETRLSESFAKGKISFNPLQINKLKKIYGIVGNHSAVQICSWSKKSLLGRGVCYKQKFYGIQCHRCAQMSPAAMWCQEACIFCWRPMEWYSRIKMKKSEVDSPEFIISETAKQRKKLLTGFKGNKDAKQKIVTGAYELFPCHWAISLSGEPTIYPKLGELIKTLKKNSEVKSVFLVSNGQEPGVLLKLQREKALPTQLYISIDACNEKMFKTINRSLKKNGWALLMKTLHKVLPKLECRKVLRYTMIKGLNDSANEIKKFAEIFEKSKSDFIEIKAYMCLGQSKKRLRVSNMPTHEEIKAYSKKLLEHLDTYAYCSEDSDSRIVLLKRKDSKYENIIVGPEAGQSLKKAEKTAKL